MASGPGKVARLGPSARKVYLLVRDALERNVPLQAALSETLLSLKLSEEVRRQATDLVYTAVRSEVRCLYVLHRIYPKFGHFPKVVQRLLVAACAALLFQEKAPAYAIVHETVADISFLCGKGMGAAANWGLRSLLRLEGAPLEESFYKEAGKPAQPSEIAGEAAISMSALLDLLNNADPAVKAQLRLALMT